MTIASVSLALTGSGGSGVMTAGSILLNAAAKAHFYGVMTRSLGPQIRGGEAAALLRIADQEVHSPDDALDLHLAFDWGNIERFSAELALTPNSIIVSDPAAGEVPDVIAQTGAKVVEVAFKELAKEIPGGRPNMLGLGLAAQAIGLPLDVVKEIITKAIAKKGQEAVDSSLACLDKGAEEAGAISLSATLSDVTATPHETGERWSISGNEAAGLGVLKGGVRFCAAYPITPATEILEWLAPNLPKVGGTLIQAEDELASINMVLGGSYGGKPSMTATSGPGLALMTESIGLGVAAEIPCVIVDVQRGGPSTGIPTKTEQVDLNIAVYGVHGDAPHIVTAPTSITDCLHTGQWSVHLAEAMQCPVIMLSDQAMGQARAVVEKPADLAFVGERRVAGEDDLEDGLYARYKITADGVSPMAVPGTPLTQYTADGLEHGPRGNPSTQANHHQEQLDKRLRKITDFDYGDRWADIEGEGDIAVITWGSVTSPVREAIARRAEKGAQTKLIAVRLINPASPEKMLKALDGVKKAIIIEQNHQGQFATYFRAHYEAPCPIETYHKPGPLPLRPAAIDAILAELAEGV